MELQLSDQAYYLKINYNKLKLHAINTKAPTKITSVMANNPTKDIKWNHKKQSIKQKESYEESQIYKTDRKNIFSKHCISSDLSYLFKFNEKTRLF